MDAAKTVLIMAGGTGGHVFPGLALAAELRLRGFGVAWLGTRAGIEYRLVPEADIGLQLIDVEGIRGRGIKALLKAPLVILRAVLQSRKIIKELKPGLVVGLGGFVAGPGGVAAKICGIPLVIHEQNAVAGTTNRLLAHFADRVLTAFPKVIAGGECIGNPVREAFFSRKQPASIDGEIKILVVGGSRGARAINALVPRALAKLGDEKKYVAVCHQAGEALIDETTDCYRQVAISLNVEGVDSLRGGDVKLVPFIEEMERHFHWADVVICRAGALTVSELAASGTASILIPLPHAIDNHQLENAKYLRDVGAAKVCEQAALSADMLANIIKSFLDDPKNINTMSEKALLCSKPQAVRDFADVCEREYQSAQ